MISDQHEGQHQHHHHHEGHRYGHQRQHHNHECIIKHLSDWTNEDCAQLVVITTMKAILKHLITINIIKFKMMIVLKMVTAIDFIIEMKF